MIAISPNIVEFAFKLDSTGIKWETKYRQGRFAFPQPTVFVTLPNAESKPRGPQDGAGGVG